MTNVNQSDIAEITPKWLTEVLRKAGIVEDSSVIAISTEQIAQGKAWLSSIVKIKVEYDYLENNAPESYILKILSESRANRDFDYELGAYQREIHFYSDIATNLPIRLPKLLYSESRYDSNLMLMEDLSYLTAGDQLVGMNQDQVFATLTSLAKVHAAFWDNPRLDCHEWIPITNNNDSDYNEKWDSFVELCGDFIEAEALEVGERLRANVGWLSDEISKRPRTLVHDDMKVDNLLFGEPKTNEEVVILDWQFVIKSMGAIDVARLIGGSWFPKDRKGYQLNALRHWHDELIDCGIQSYSWEDAQRDFKLGALYNLCFPVHFHKGISRAQGRALEYIQSLYSSLFSLAVELECRSVLPG